MPRLGRGIPNRPVVRRGYHGDPYETPPVHQSHTALTETGSLTNLSFTVPGVAIDEVVLVQIHKNPSAAITPPTGFTQKSQVANTSQQHTVFWGRRGGGSDIGAGPYNFTWTGATFAGGSAHRISGCVTTGDPFDVIDHEFSNTGATSTPAVQATTVASNTLLVWMANGFQNATVWTPPAGFTKVFEQNNLTAAWLNDLVAGDTGALTGSTAVTDVKNAFLGALKPVPVGAVGTDASAGSATAVPFAAADALAALALDAGPAAVGFVAADAGVSVAVNAGSATIAVAAADATAALTVDAGPAAVAFTAADATVSTAVATNADAQPAAVGFTAADASVALTTDAGAAAVPVTAADAVGSVGALAGSATVGYVAADASVAITVDAGSATVPFTAADATVSTAAFTSADAQPAILDVTAADAQASVAPAAGSATVPFTAADAAAINAVDVQAQAATITLAAADAAAAIGVNAGAATVPFAAADATGQTSVAANAGSATITITAADATAALAAQAQAASVPIVAADAVAFIPPPVPAPRWFEGDSSGAGVVEGSIGELARTNLLTTNQATGTDALGTAEGFSARTQGTIAPSVTFSRSGVRSAAWSTGTPLASTDRGFVLRTSAVVDSTWTAVQPATAYTVSAYLRSSLAVNMKAGMEWYDAAGVLIGSPVFGGGVAISTVNFNTRITYTATSPAATAYMVPLFLNATTTASPAIVYLDDPEAAHALWGVGVVEGVLVGAGTVEGGSSV